MSAGQMLRPNLTCALRRTVAHSASTSQLDAASRAAPFSTTAVVCKRKTKDSNKNRGVSSLYRSGPREPLSMSGIPLPKPKDFKPAIKVSEKHGLWGFFPEPNKLVWTPKETEGHGRAWTVEELRKKSWEDLHALWWVCCKERNMLATGKAELARAKLGFGETEFDQRDDEVRKTMRSIKHALTERFYTWQDAVEVAKEDPEINLEGSEGEVYNPSSYEEEYKDGEAWEDVDPSAPAASDESAQEVPKGASR